MCRRSLQGAALQATHAGGSVGEAASDALDGMGDDLYALVEGEASDASGEEAVRCVAFFSRQASGWAAVGRRQRARACLERAMRHASALEAQVAAQAGASEQHKDKVEAQVVALFSLYLQGSKSAAEGKQQVGAGRGWMRDGSVGEGSFNNMWATDAAHRRMPTGAATKAERAALTCLFACRCSKPIPALLLPILHPNQLHPTPPLRPWPTTC